jgi:hypothetical protein
MPGAMLYVARNLMQPETLENFLFVPGILGFYFIFWASSPPDSRRASLETLNLTQLKHDTHHTACTTNNYTLSPPSRSELHLNANFSEENNGMVERGFPMPRLSRI